MNGAPLWNTVFSSLNTSVGETHSFVSCFIAASSGKDDSRSYYYRQPITLSTHIHTHICEYHNEIDLKKIWNPYDDAYLISVLCLDLMKLSLFYISYYNVSSVYTLKLYYYSCLSKTDCVSLPQLHLHNLNLIFGLSQWFRELQRQLWSEVPLLPFWLPQQAPILEPKQLHVLFTWPLQCSNVWPICQCLLFFITRHLTMVIHI